MVAGMAERAGGVERERGQIEFVRRLGAAVTSAVGARRRLHRALIEGSPSGVAAVPRLGEVAEECGLVFDEARWMLNLALTPRGAELCTQALRSWLDLHVEACDALTRAAGTGQIAHVRTAVQLLRASQPYAHEFNRVRGLLAERLAA